MLKTPNRINIKKITCRQIMIKLLKTKDKKKTFLFERKHLGKKKKKDILPSQELIKAK